jgi:hypothetical protein
MHRDPLSARRGRRSLQGGRALVLAVAVAAVVGCSAGWQVREVTDVDGAVALDLSSCNATYAVTVAETADEVRVGLEQMDAGDRNNDCADELRFDLERPLGDRAVIINGEPHDVIHPDPAG